jgi:hypothetical protein
VISLQAIEESGLEINVCKFYTASVRKFVLMACNFVTEEPPVFVIISGEFVAAVSTCFQR